MIELILDDIQSTKERKAYEQRKNITLESIKHHQEIIRKYITEIEVKLSKNKKQIV